MDSVERYAHILSLIENINEQIVNFNNDTDIINNIPISPIVTNGYNRYNSQEEEEELDIMNDILQESLYNDKPVYIYLLSEEGERQLELVEYDKNIHCNECPIVKHEFEEGEYITRLPCGHVFDPESIKKWLQTESAICPVCRFKLKSIEVKVEEPSDDDDDS